MHTRSGLTYNNTDVEETISEREYYAQLAAKFRNWKSAVNQLCVKSINMECDDLPDLDYYSSFVEGLTPREMFNVISREFYDQMMG